VTSNALLCTYMLDADLRITAVDEGWCVFALANGTPELVPPKGPIGRSVLDGISDFSTAQLYRELFQHVQTTGRPLAVPFRCDSPTLRRFLELQIERRNEGGLRVRSVLIRTEPRESVRLLEPNRRFGDGLLKMCSWCKTVEVDGT
jgi:hypothetical protein